MVRRHISILFHNQKINIRVDIKKTFAINVFVKNILPRNLTQYFIIHLIFICRYFEIEGIIYSFLQIEIAIMEPQIFFILVFVMPSVQKQVSGVRG